MPPTYRSKWQPRSVRRPDNGDFFSLTEAWAFVQRQMEEGIEIEIIILKQPPGKAGFVIKAPGYGGEVIYIKLQLVGDKVIGRSFHTSQLPGGDD